MFRKYLPWLGLTLLIFLPACGAEISGEAAQSATTDADVAAIYRLAMQDIFKDRTNRGNILIREQTLAIEDQDPRSANGYQDVFSALLDETRESYIANNAASRALPKDLSLGYPYRMVRDYTEVTGDASFFVFSAIGFDAAGDQALVYVGYGCGDLCGVGKVYLLEREAEAWRIQSGALLEVS